MRKSNAKLVVPVGVMMAAGLAAPAAAQVRIAEWNITNYAAPELARCGVQDGAVRHRARRPAVRAGCADHSGVGAGRLGKHSVAPGDGAVQRQRVSVEPEHRTGSPGDWAAATYVANGGDDGNALFYRTSKFVHMGTTALTTNTGTGPNQAPRDTQRWQLRLVGYSGIGAQCCMSTGRTSRRGARPTMLCAGTLRGSASASTATRLRRGANFLLGADMNIQNSQQLFYQYMIGLDSTPPVGEEFSRTPRGTSSTRSTRRRRGRWRR